PQGMVGGPARIAPLCAEVQDGACPLPAVVGDRDGDGRAGAAAVAVGDRVGKSVRSQGTDMGRVLDLVAYDGHVAMGALGNVGDRQLVVVGVRVVGQDGDGDGDLLSGGS